MLCQCPKLTPLQSRLAASISALALLALIYWTLSGPQFAYAAELAVDGAGQIRSGEDHNWHRISGGVVFDGDEVQAVDDEEQMVLAEKRATSQNTTIQGNNIGTPADVAAGSLTLWQYPSKQLTSPHAANGTGLPGQVPGLTVSQPESDGGTTVYISANVCEQPRWVGVGAQTFGPPQLTLYVSTTPNNQDLGPSGTQQIAYNFTGGFVNASIPGAATGDWYMAVSAPTLSSNFSGSWNYQMAVSIDDYFHRADSTNFLHLIDTDDHSALLFTDNLTTADADTSTYKSWANISAPFILLATNDNYTGYMGLENSFCGLQTFVRNHSQIQASQKDLAGEGTQVEMGIVTRGLGNKPKQQFYVKGLNTSTPYTAFLAMDGNSTASGDGVVRGGGTVWNSKVDFTTKADGNCQLMYNLTFCSEVAYAVPANPQNPDVSTFDKLQHFYDNYTMTWYKPFTYTLGQIACSTTPGAQYSMAKTCDDCAKAYKQWLCAVSIPRCEDFSNPAGYLQRRNMGQPFWNNNSMLEDEIINENYQPMSRAPSIQGSNAYDQTYISSFATNQSRNSEIDTFIRPGPYKEVLPCDDLCYSLMQSCPAALEFACPYPGKGLETSYRRRNASSGNVECSYLGAYFYRNDALGLVPGALNGIVAAGILSILLVFGL